MTHDLVLHQIKNNNLSGSQYSFVVAQICVLNNKPYGKVTSVIEDLIASNELLLGADETLILAKGNKPTQYNYEDKLTHKNRHKRNPNKNLIEGKIQGTKGNFSFLIPFDTEQEDVYIKNENLLGALHGDAVAVEVFKNKRGLEGKVVKVLERGATTVVGKITFNGNFAFVSADDVKFGKDIFVQRGKTLNASEGEKVVVKITKYHTDGKNPQGEVVEVLGMPNGIETEVLSIIRSHSLYEDFPKKVEVAAENMPDIVNKQDFPNRRDLTNELIFTIDGADARDLDDAISLAVNDNGGYVLGVHIADVSEYVKLHSPIDNEAFKRATSVYFPSLVLPMLPRALSNGICSLNEMVERLALSVFITYNSKAQVVDYDIAETIIKSKKRFTYDEVQQVLNGDTTARERNKHFVKTLVNMNELAKRLAENRHKRGAIDFDLPEVKIELNDLGDVLTVKPQSRDDSHKLIESFMIAANEVIAEHFSKRKLPFVYRIHEKPDAIKMNTFASFIKQFGFTNVFNAEDVKPKELQAVLEAISDNDVKYVVNKICLRSLKKAKYDPVCQGHFGLASTFYCHFTSPIRRYPDLTIHRIIKDDLHGRLTGNKLSEAKHFVGASSLTSSEREVIAERVERDVDDLYKTLFMSHHLMEEFEGRINSVTAYGVYVELDNTVEGLLRLEDLPADQYKFNETRHALTGMNGEFVIGMRLRVKAIRADILAREIDFILV